MAQTSSASASRRPDGPGHGSVRVAGITLAADCAGALYWPEEGLLVVADLHLEKGSSFARRGQLLPPYDTTETLARLARLVAHYAPRVVITLGDNFHDGGGHARLSAADRASLTALQRGRDWIWITGNHDPDPAEGIGGSFGATLTFGKLQFRHEPSRDAPEGEIAGHLHPVARIVQRGRAVSRRCFATDGQSLVMPAFGAYTGGLNVRDHAFGAVFGARKFTAHMLGDNRLYAFAASRCLSD
jgi:DNA ligase-associated metallophosphoesterase